MVDQREEEQRQSLVDLGTGSHGLMDGEIIAKMSGSHQMYTTRMSGTLIHPVHAVIKLDRSVPYHAMNEPLDKK